MFFPLPPVGSCAFSFDVTAGTIALHSDGGQVGPAARLGARSTMENSQCVLDAEKSAVTSVGSTTVVDVALMFRGTWAGAKLVLMLELAGVPFYPLGGFLVVPAVEAPEAFGLPGYFRIGFPGRGPVERARLVFGPSDLPACVVLYERAGGLVTAAGSCGLSQSLVKLVGDDLILSLFFRGDVSRVVSAAQTPVGGVDSGLFPVAMAP